MLVSVVAAVLVAMVACSSGDDDGGGADDGAGSATTTPSDSLQSLTDGLVDELSASFDVGTGSPTLYTEAECQDTYPALSQCMGNNPAAPYILPVVPSWPDEFSDPALENAFGETSPGHSATFRLDPREAVVFFGTMPPAGRYLSLQTYVATREGTFDTSSPSYQAVATVDPKFLDVLFLTVPANPSRVESFSSIGNAINDVDIEQQSGTSFGTQKFFIITPDAGMETAVRDALHQSGVSDADIFTEPVSYPDMRLGLDASADDFLGVMRYALPDDASAGDDWRDTLPLSVVRVRERPSSTRAAQPYPTSVYEARSATPEAQYSSDLDGLVAAVCDRWGGCDQPAPIGDLQAPPLNQIGPTCRQVGMNCLGDGQDSPYYYSGQLPLDDGEVYAVVDTLGTQTGNATYVSLGINDTSRLLGVASVDDPTLEGTAMPYSSTVDDADKFFVYYVTRDCDGLEDLTNGNCVSITTDMVPTGAATTLSLREYIRPGTARGADSAQLLQPLVVKLTPP
jgi:hypothetical protein